ncbi:MAG: M1 family aminopeptidase [Bacteroidota bacterium]
MVEFFSQKIGYVYPWEKYAQVTIADFMWGGMENTSATTLNDKSAVFDKRAELDRSSRGLIAHELAHQWWGDLITCKDWRHLWLNEGFATYFEALHQEYRLGTDEFAYNTYRDQRAAISSDKTSGRKPIVSVNSFRANLFERGAMVLHMLRFVLGDELFWKAIRHYAHQYQYRSVETNDFKLAIEESTGQNLSWFFDQWIYKAGYPEFEVTSHWDESARSITLSIKQVQKIDSLTNIFRTPLDIEITTASGARTHRVLISEKQEEFTIPVDSKPLLVVFDKGNWILKEVRFPRSRKELIYQLRSSGDAVERLTALEQLRSDSDAVSTGASFRVFRDVVLSDPFWAVRMEAVNAIGRMTIPEAEDALIEAYKDQKSKVRQAVVNNLSRFPGQRVRNFLRQAMEEDPSYVVNADALKAYAKVDSASAYDVAVSHLKTPSYDNGVCNAALSVLASLEDERAVPHLIKYSTYGQPKKTREVALAGLRSFVENEKAVQDWTIGLVEDQMKEVRLAAIRMLDRIGGDRVIETLMNLKARETDEEVLGAIEAELEELKRQKG